MKGPVEPVHRSVPETIQEVIELTGILCFLFRSTPRQDDEALKDSGLKTGSRCPAGPRCSSLHNAAGNSTTGQGGAPHPHTPPILNSDDFETRREVRKSCAYHVFIVPQFFNFFLV